MIDGPFNSHLRRNAAETGCECQNWTGWITAGDAAILVHCETAARLSETSNQRMELMQFSLQMLVHQQKRLERSPDVAITCCDDFLDGDLGSLGTHLRYPATNNPRQISLGN